MDSVMTKVMTTGKANHTAGDGGRREGSPGIGQKAEGRHIREQIKIQVKILARILNEIKG